MTTSSQPHTIRIATRQSPLALWQANTVMDRLKAINVPCELMLIESSGDLNLTSPVYAMGITGVFTKELDIALLEKRADIAVHSLKDVPTQLAEGLSVQAVLERGSSADILISKDSFNPEKATQIATSSLRRRAQWLMRYPHHTMAPIRGNVQTRLRKFSESIEVEGVIFAKAGLERMNLLNGNITILDWMLPAPAQGIVGVVCRSEDEEICKILNQINHQPTFIEGIIEREFMRTLLGGCSVPVSALAKTDGETITFKGAIHAIDGSRCNIIEKTISATHWKGLGMQAAQELLQQEGAESLLNEIRAKNEK